MASDPVPGKIVRTYADYPVDDVGQAVAACPRAGRVVGGCQFQPRYDKGPSQATFDGGVTELRLRVLEAYRQVTYVRDICVRCGRTVERDRA